MNRRADIDLFANEQGGRDWRMLPVAIAVWMACLGTHALFTWMFEGSQTGFQGFAGIGVPAGMMLAGAALVGTISVFAISKSGMRALAVVMACAACCAGAITFAADLQQWHDPAAAQARASPVTVMAEATIIEPATASNRSEYDCQANARTHMLDTGMIRQPSHAIVRVYASETYCASIARGARIAFTGTLSQAEWGTTGLWLDVQGIDPVRRISDPDAAHAVIAGMQESFFAVTDRLSDQGRVLVPGLTLGVLGQDHVGGESGSIIDDTYAAMLEDQFRKAGIMHLMAVSGGHFAIIAAGVRRIGSWLLLDRRITAALLAIAHMLLAAMVFPSASVTRALIMGLISCTALAIGRRPQAMSALCWTVILTLVIEPGMARSYGFALSAAAVLGIIVFSARITRHLHTLMPKALAGMLAMTVSAQLFTMPIQILMEPELPLLSAVANLVVAPFVGVATLAGLAALMVAWLSPELAYACAWLASCGTIVMERVAVLLGGTHAVTLPWSSGIPGAISMMVCETAAVAIIVVCARWRARERGTRDGLPGTRMGSAWRSRIAIWFTETERVLVQRYGEIGDYGQNSSGESSRTHRDGRRRISQRADRAGPVSFRVAGASGQRIHRAGRLQRRPLRLR